MIVGDFFPKLINGIHDEYAAVATLEELPVSVDILRDIIAARSELNTIAVREVDVETSNLLGQIRFYYPTPTGIHINESPTSAVITVKEDLNFCWKRFVICKELCHCLIDNDGERVTTEDGLMTLLEGLASKINLEKEGGPLHSEQLAEILALELLYPMKFRRSHIEGFRKGKITAHNLALRYRIPAQFAEFGMYDTYFNAMDALFKRDEGGCVVNIRP